MIELLRGVRVVECAVLFNGDLTGRMLGDLGADVIKVEAPGVGDYLRDFLGQVTPHHSPAHLHANRNKRSMVVNLKSEDGRRIFFDLLKTADIFVDGFAADACARLGIGYADQVKVKPDIIYAQCSGFGARGPYAGIPTHGMMMGALAGGTPMRMGEDGFAQPDGEGMGDGTTVAASYTAMAAIAALHHRARTGQGAYIDGSGADAVLATNWFRAIYAWNDDRITDRRGMGGGLDAAKYSFYETKDGRFIMFCGIEQKFWTGFCRAAGRADLLGEDRIGSEVDYGRDEGLKRTLQDVFHSRTQAEWLELARQNHLPIGPAHRTEDLRSDPHLASREVICETDHPHAGPFADVGWPAPVEGQRFTVWRPAPLLGEHTEEILAELGAGETT